MRQEAVETAVSRFAALPVSQRSAVILKDVLDAPLSEIAMLLDLTADAVKGHLARGRARLRRINAEASPPSVAPAASEAVSRYVALFMGTVWSYLDATALGRQEVWEDSPDGYSQTQTYKWWNWHDSYEPDAAPDPKWVQVSDAGEAAFRGDGA
jgi:hypothetical protein